MQNIKVINEISKREDVVDVLRIWKFQLLAFLEAKMRKNRDVTDGVTGICPEVQEIERGWKVVGTFLND